MNNNQNLQQSNKTLSAIRYKVQVYEGCNTIGAYYAACKDREIICSRFYIINAK